MESFQDIEHFVKTLSAAIKKKIPTKVSQLTNDVGYKTTDTNTTYKLSKSGSTVTLTGSDGSTTSVTDSNTTYSSLKNPYSLDIQNNGTTVASYDGSTAKTANFTNATSSANGLMSKSDKAKLDGIGAGSNVKSVNGKTGVVTINKADVGLGNVDNTKDADKPYYKLIGQTETNTNKVGHFEFNDASCSLYKILDFYAASGEGDYFYLLHKKSDYTITTTKHFSNTAGLFTANLSNDCAVATNLISESNPAILTITRNSVITATDVLTLIFYEHRGWQTNALLNHWKLEVMAAGANSSNYTKHTWKDGDWLTVFERTNVSDHINRLWCGLNPYKDDGLTYILIKGIRITIYAATPFSTKSGDFGYNLLEIAGMRLLDSRPSFSPAEALGALDVAGGTVYGKTTFQEGISATSFSGATATSSADGLMSKADKAKLDGIGTGSNVKSVNGKTGAVTLAKGDVGLGNVANLDQSKAIKSITRSGTTFTATALDGTTTTFTQQDSNTTYSVATSSTDGLMSKTDKAKLDGIGAGSNVKSVNGKTGVVTLSKADVGLGNVDNTKDADKPISTAVQTALDAKANNSAATESTDGLMSAADKAKLDGITSTYATKSELSSHSQNTSNPHKVTASQVGALPLSGGSLTGNLTAPSFQTGTGNANYFQCRKFRGEGDANTYYHAVDFGYAGHDQVDFYEYGGKYVFHRHRQEAKSSGDAIIGEINDNGFVGKVNGHTVNADVPAGAKFTDTTYSNATTSVAGLMSPTDKAKLDGISSGADAVTIKTVKVNGTALTPDSSKAVNVTVPTLANNATTTTSGMALDARMGKTLSDQISSVKAGAIDQIVNLTAAGWTGDAAPYSQTVNVTGMTEDLLCELFSACPKTATVAEREAYNEAFALVASGYAETTDGSATFLVDEKPAIDIGVRIVSLRRL